MAVPGTANLTLYRGDDFEQAIDLTQAGEPLVLPTTGWTAQARTNPDGEIVATFAVDASDGATGRLLLSLAGTATVTMPPTSVWDLQCTTGGTKTYLAGKVKIVKDVTRA